MIKVFLYLTRKYVDSGIIENCFVPSNFIQHKSPALPVRIWEDPWLARWPSPQNGSERRINQWVGYHPRSKGFIWYIYILVYLDNTVHICINIYIYAHVDVSWCIVQCINNHCIYIYTVYDIMYTHYVHTIYSILYIINNNVCSYYIMDRQFSWSPTQ